MKIYLEIEVPISKEFESLIDDCSKEQVNEWVKFNIGAIGGVNMHNPLADYTLFEDSDLIRCSIICD